ncbi:hypothetical protein E2C01_081721 [Portunus trituberculatus]|uniref:Uncharacterized protein n=1 Tax=Portunus trituberculatus TaxID=210409 RepID=A0A5B7IX95_PORTR|nr:hypothetical protein [Portunus trituberculatus]
MDRKDLGEDLLVQTSKLQLLEITCPALGGVSLSQYLTLPRPSLIMTVQKQTSKEKLLTLTGINLEVAHSTVHAIKFFLMSVLVGYGVLHDLINATSE